jgi:hypothetical protein
MCKGKKFIYLTALEVQSPRSVGLMCLASGEGLKAGDMMVGAHTRRSYGKIGYQSDPEVTLTLS